MIIGLDYDDTWTKDPEAWFTAMSAMKAAGHTIVGATLRNQKQPIDPSSQYFDVCDYVIYCCGRAKKKVAAHFGLDVEVWIDDLPLHVQISWEELHGTTFMGNDPNAEWMQPMLVNGNG